MPVIKCYLNDRIWKDDMEGISNAHIRHKKCTQNIRYPMGNTETGGG